MDKYQNSRAYQIDKHVPGCLGRMVNLFDVSAGVSANRLLTDKPHLEGPPSRNRSEGARMLNSSSGTKKRNKMASPDLRNVYYIKSHPTTEMVSSDETYKEAESKHSPPNLVARLMGLSDLPLQQQDSTMERSQILTYLPQEDKDYKDVYEVQNRSRTYLTSETKKEMDFVHRKFVEHHAKSEKVCQFKDAEEFLLKFLPEPNALISKDKPELLSLSDPPRTKRITVLRPSKMNDHEKFPVLVKRENLTEGSADKNPPCVYPDYLDVDDYESEPTQIVVLKPSIHGTVSSVSVPSTSPEVENRIGESRQMAKEAKYLRHRTHGRDETSVSSGFFNDYGGGDSNSFSKSEYEYAAQNFIDFEFIPSTAKHSSSDGIFRQETHTGDRSSYTLGEMFGLKIEEDGDRIHLDQTCLKGSDSGKKTASLSFKGKVSSLLFSKNKRSTGKNPQSSEEPRHSLLTESSPHSAMLTSPNQEMSISKPMMCRNTLENQDQPSPVSVLELFYEEDATQTSESSGKQLLSPGFHSCSSIGKSPLIGSVARTLTRDGSCSEQTHASSSRYPLNAEDNEFEWISFHGAMKEWKESERLASKDVVLRDFWDQELRLEIHRMEEEFEGELLEELVEQTVSHLLLGHIEHLLVQ